MIRTLADAKQAALNGAVKGLRSQRWARSEDPVREECLLQKRPGVRCAVGWLTRLPLLGPFDDGDSLRGEVAGDIYCVTANKALVKPLQRFFDEAEEGVRDDFDGFLGSLQEAHDEKGGTMATRFRRLAKEHGLTYPRGA